MVAYSFKKRFADAVESGAKSQTIRAPRKRHARPGELVQLYTGMRTKQCRRLGYDVCKDVLAIDLDFSSDTITLEDSSVIKRRSQLDELAQRDGFADWDEMKSFWPNATFFSGVLIMWEPILTDNGVHDK